MDIINTTPFKFAQIAGRLNHPGHSLTLIVKGTFDLSPGGKAVEAEEQLSPTGDEFYPDDDEQTGSLRYESDFAYFKPRADLLLVGKCHAPGGDPVPACPVAFGVGSVSKRLMAFGDRRWKTGWPLIHTITDPEPFTQMELGYVNSYGGTGYRKNPAGKGYGKDESETGDKVRLLPNIEDPDSLINSPFARPEPAGFGPLGRMWQHRFSKMGSYKGDYLKKRWPWFPEDFDWGHFNAAPPAMQADGYLRGDEELYFKNLHPEYQRYNTELPGLRIRCFINTVPELETGKYQFKEAQMNLDTLWVDMEEEKLVLLWRGWTEAQSGEFEEVRHIFIMSEPAGQEPGDLARCHELFIAALEAEKMKWEAGPEEPPEEPEETEAPEIKEPGPEAAEEVKTGKPDTAAIKAQTAALLAQVGLNLDRLPPEARKKIDEEQDRIINKLTEEDPAKAMEEELRESEARMEAAFSGLGIDVNNPPPASDKAKSEQLRFMKEMGFGDADISADGDSARFMALTTAVMSKMGVDTENLTPLIREAKKFMPGFMMEEEEEEAEVKEEEQEYLSGLTRETVKERAARGDSFAGENLSGLDLSGLDLKKLDFSGAVFTGVSLKNADLSFAILSGCNLEKADLSGADLTGAVLAKANLDRAKLDGACLQESLLTGASLNKVKMSRAILNDAVFEKAKMTGAVLNRVEGKDAGFVEADLSDTSFAYGKLPGADFSGSVLNNVNFRKAVLKEASVEGAKGVNSNFTKADITELRASGGCDFSNACFTRAAGAGSMWENANLTEADFSYADMEGAFFTKATMEKANLFGSNMKFARFVKANLRDAKLVRMNLFEGSLEKADLTGADMTGSNMYSVEFSDAVFRNTVIVDTNLKMTKLKNV